MGDPRYSRTAFWIVKVLMLLCLATWLHNISKEAGRQEILSKKPVQRVLSDAPYCWNGSYYPIVDFNYRKMLMKVKKEPLESAITGSNY